MTEATFQKILNNETLTQTQSERIRKYINAEGNDDERVRRLTLYLSSFNWIQKTAAIQKQTEGLCVYCGSNEQPEVIHLRYVRLGVERTTDTALLCVGCRNRVKRNNLGINEVEETIRKRISKDRIDNRVFHDWSRMIHPRKERKKQPLKKSTKLLAVIKKNAVKTNEQQ